MLFSFLSGMVSLSAARNTKCSYLHIFLKAGVHSFHHKPWLFHTPRPLGYNSLQRKYDLLFIRTSHRSDSDMTGFHSY